MATIDTLMTADEYLLLPNIGKPTELVKGRLVEMNMPYPRHGEVCLQAGFLLKTYLKDHPFGRATSNDSGIITERDPDTVRGPDIAFYSFDDVEKSPLPKKYAEKPPRLVFEVLSPSDRWKDVHKKVGEYLGVGVHIVCVLDPDEEKVYVYHADKPEQILSAEDELTLTDVLPEFRVSVASFFE